MTIYKSFGPEKFRYTLQGRIFLTELWGRGSSLKTFSPFQRNLLAQVQIHIHTLSQGPDKSWGKKPIRQLPRLHIQNKTTQTTFTSLVKY